MGDAAPKLATRDEVIAFLRVSPEQFDRDVEPHMPKIPISRKVVRYQWPDVESIAWRISEGRIRVQPDAVVLVAPEPSSDDGFVYFIGSRAFRPIKVGFSDRPRERLADLQTAHPFRLNLLASVTGPFSLEGRLHRVFAADRLMGEWFRRTSRLERLIKACGSGSHAEAMATIDRIEARGKRR
jgi:hypothetical protein